MAERPRELGDVNDDRSAMITVTLNFRLKGYVSGQYLWTIR